MNIKVNPVIWQDGNFTAVPSVIIDKHLRLCGSLALKVILLILRDRDSYKDETSIREKLKCDASDLCDALNYWEEAGILKLSDEKEFKELPKEEPNIKKEEPKEEKKHFVMPGDSEKSFVLTREEVNAMVKNDKMLFQLVQEAQRILGKNFNSYDLITFVAIYSCNNLSPHFMLTLLNFCEAVNKKTLPYLRRVAEDWIENGVDDNTVDSYMDTMLNLFSMEGRVKAALGLDRNLIKQEREYVKKWVTEYHMDVDIILAAYETCISAINKINFKYMDKTLDSWYQSNVTTREELEVYLEQRNSMTHHNGSSAKDNSEFTKFVLDNYDKE